MLAQKLLIIGILLCYLSTAVGQSTIDSIPILEQQVQALFKEARKYEAMPSKILDSLWSVFHRMEAVCAAQNKEDCQYVLYKTAFLIHDETLQFQKAISWGKRGLDLAIQNANVTQQLAFYRRLGIGYDRVGDITQSIRYFLTGLNLSKLHNKMEYEMLFHTHVGFFYETYGNDEISRLKARSAHKEALRLAQALQDSNILSMSYLNLAATEVNADSAMLMLQWAERYNRTSLDYITLQWALVHMLRGDTLTAIAEFHDIIEKQKGYYDNHVKQKAHQELALYYLHHNNLRKALHHAKLAFKLNEGYNESYRYAVNLKILSDIYYQLQQYDIAYDYLAEYFKVSEKLDFQRGELYYMINILEAELVQKEQEKQILLNKKQADRRFLIMFAGSTSVLLLLSITSLILLGRLYNLRQKKHAALRALNDVVSKQKEELLEKNEQLASTLKKESALSHQLRRSNAELSNFAHTISHDLKEPLRTISSFGQLLQRHYDSNTPNDQLGKYVHFMISGAHRMNRLINDLLRYSELNFEHIRLQTVNLNEIMQEVQNHLHPLIEESKAQIECDALPWVRATNTHMFQLLQNMLSNALKYRHSQRRPYIAIRYEQQAATITIRVSDNGVGIPQAFKAQAFKLFNRLDTTRPDSSGVGLAICKKIVENYDGEIRLESELEQGTTFLIIFPKAMQVSG
ncbi:MAG TPA: ATP-binding protein [Saprospiraceae bacterium]|nr:ATP-binding protein [Saprospiraceae bacterium]HMP13815.1 ATP-binding protein [Saprospiraceae bacterium]